MNDFAIDTLSSQIKGFGYTIIPSVFTNDEINTLTQFIDSADSNNSTFRKSSDLFAIRQFLKEIPEIKGIIFNENLKHIIHNLFGDNYFVVKSIYFDKPESSNWFVAYHQDLTISVDQKMELKDFGPWIVRQNQYAVQPPLEILENIFTIRIHLDDTNENNGALKVISDSHKKGIYRPENIDWNIEKEDVCHVPSGGIMIMKPLLLHSSSRTTDHRKRRVIHIEFSDIRFSNGLNWSEIDPI